MKPMPLPVVGNLLVSDGQVNTLPTRIYVYYEPDDKFFSILFGYRYRNQITSLQDLKFPIIESLYAKDLSVITITGSNCHLATGKWNIEHCEAEPVFWIEKESIEPFIYDIKKPKIVTRSLKKTIIVKNDDPINTEDNENISEDNIKKDVPKKSNKQNNPDVTESLKDDNNKIEGETT